MRWLLLAFLIISAAEIGVLVWAGSLIGPWWVVVIILLTGFIGVSLAKREGLETWKRAQYSMQYGQVPAKELLDGICILIGGVFLFSPGFITDIAGFILVLPQTRRYFKLMLGRLIKKLIDSKTIIINRR
ncbi:membrane protein FxsA [Ornithinibacillus sp. BX22]|uniref:Membrane protein FxsA n=2 Tax=Ornithinibacillus TaxID=484508 RepID=A0A923L6X0_9BACI|nr:MULTISPECIES: FxsA family protein [Ornithinibacillus]MBC5637480.1 membrane protein FxsA [Ornithinibacillus hominis]MBS3682049.1 membrane protein FxsA [Ornithinibacillus massiliensis]